MRLELFIAPMKAPADSVPVAKEEGLWETIKVIVQALLIALVVLPSARTQGATSASSGTTGELALEAS